MGRGIYVQNGIENNHTFNVALHVYQAQCQLSIIENVQPTVICPPSINADALADALYAVENTTISEDIENCSTSACAKNLNVLDQSDARERYRYVLWMDQYIVFEITPAATLGGTSMRLGAAAYFEYDDIPFELTDDTHISAVLLRLKCARTVCGGVCGNARGVCRCTSARALLLVTPLVFLKYFWEFVIAGGGVCDNQLNTDMNTDAMHDLLIYTRFGIDIVHPVIRPAYEENMKIFKQQCARFYVLHPELTGVAHNGPGSKWWRALVIAGGRQVLPIQQKNRFHIQQEQCNKPAQHGVTHNTNYNVAEGACMLPLRERRENSYHKGVIEGAWIDASFYMLNSNSQYPNSTRCAYQHVIPNSNLQRDMSVLLYHCNDLIRAYQSMQPHRNPPATTLSVRDRLRTMLGLIDECLCGKFLDEFRTRVTPEILHDMRTVVDLNTPTEHLQQGLLFFLYQSIAFLLHYTRCVRSIK